MIPQTKTTDTQYDILTLCLYCIKESIEMSDLSTKDKRELEAIFRMGGGFYLEFSNDSLNYFISETVDLELYSEKYNLKSGSKANRIRAIWATEPNHLVGKLIRETIEFYDLECQIKIHYIKLDPTRKSKCLQIAQRLESDIPFDTQAAFTPQPVQAVATQAAFKPNRSSQGAFTVVTPHKLINTEEKIMKNKVFIVHGHDDLAKEQVARFISQVGLVPIILHEQASSSATIIEKIEKYADQVCFAIVIYSPCDQGSIAGASELSLRARQNVVFEHGYFIAKLSRKNVTAIVKGNIEKPNDISGVVYETFDDSGAWKFKLAKEMKASGCKIDMNDII